MIVYWEDYSLVVFVFNNNYCYYYIVAAIIAEFWINLKVFFWSFQLLAQLQEVRTCLLYFFIHFVRSIIISIYMLAHVHWFAISHCFLWSLVTHVAVNNLEFCSQLTADSFTFFGDNISLLEGLQLLGSRLIAEEIRYLLE